MNDFHQIVFYDGDCGFCNRSVMYILRHNKKDPFLYFASLQSDFANDFFRKKGEPLPDLSSLVFFENGHFYYRSTGALRIGKHLNRHKFLSRVVLLIPVIIRDSVYNFIAKHRKKIYKQEICQLPSEKERHRFLG